MICYKNRGGLLYLQSCRYLWILSFFRECDGLYADVINLAQVFIMAAKYSSGKINCFSRTSNRHSKKWKKECCCLCMGKLQIWSLLETVSNRISICDKTSPFGSCHRDLFILSVTLADVWLQPPHVYLRQSCVLHVIKSVGCKTHLCGFIVGVSNGNRLFEHIMFTVCTFMD